MRWGTLLIKIPDNWMTELIHNRSDIALRVFGCMPYESTGGRGLVRIVSEKNLDAILYGLRKRKDVIRANFSRASGCSVLGEVVIEKCAACTALKQSECFMVSSKSSTGGWLEWTVAAEKNSTIYNLVDLLDRNGCDVLLNRISASSCSIGLTQRQEELLQFAYSNGYYEYPRRIRLSELSRIFDISSSTMSEILRAGQRRVFSEYFRTP